MREPYDRGGDELSINVEKKPPRMIIVKIWTIGDIWKDNNGMVKKDMMGQ